MAGLAATLQLAFPPTLDQPTGLLAVVGSTLKCLLGNMEGWELTAFLKAGYLKLLSDMLAGQRCKFVGGCLMLGDSW